MRPLFALAPLVTAGLLFLSAQSAQAQVIVTSGWQPAPVVIQPTPVFYQPAPVFFQPAPVFVQPAPVFVQPRRPGLFVGARGPRGGFVGVRRW